MIYKYLLGKRDIFNRTGYIISYCNIEKKEYGTELINIDEEEVSQEQMKTLLKSSEYIVCNYELKDGKIVSKEVFNTPRIKKYQREVLESMERVKKFLDTEGIKCEYSLKTKYKVDMEILNFSIAKGDVVFYLPDGRKGNYYPSVDIFGMSTGFIIIESKGSKSGIMGDLKDMEELRKKTYECSFKEFEINLYNFIAPVKKDTKIRINFGGFEQKGNRIQPTCLYFDFRKGYDFLNILQSENIVKKMSIVKGNRIKVEILENKIIEILKIAEKLGYRITVNSNDLKEIEYGKELKLWFSNEKVE